jgi:Spy/CpxP family protein refolding chaperone
MKKSAIAAASIVLPLVAGLSTLAQQPSTGQPVMVVERIRDLNLTDSQEAAIASIRDEYEPKVDQAVDQLEDVIKQEKDAARAVLTPEQLAKLSAMKEQRKDWRYESAAERMARLRDLDLTDDEVNKLVAIRKEFRPKIVKALEGLKGILTPEQAKMREDALKAGKPRRDVLASLNLTDDQKAKMEAVGTEVRGLVKEELKQMRDVLDPEQREKFSAMKEERREQARARVMFAVDSLKDLNLTDQQKTQLKSIQAEYSPKVEEAGNQLRALIREQARAILDVIRT